MGILPNQSTFTNIALVLVGTASMFSDNQHNINNSIPSKSYHCECKQKQNLDTYSLKHEITQNKFGNGIKEILIDMPVVKQISVKFNKINITPLEFTCVENNEGFVG